MGVTSFGGGVHAVGGKHGNVLGRILAVYGAKIIRLGLPNAEFQSLQCGPLAVINGVIPPKGRVVTPVTNFFRPFIEFIGVLTTSRGPPCLGKVSGKNCSDSAKLDGFGDLLGFP